MLTLLFVMKPLPSNNQVDILRSLQHPAIVELKGLFEQAGERLYLVMELCEGGELFDRIVKKVKLMRLPPDSCPMQARGAASTQQLTSPRSNITLAHTHARAQTTYNEKEARDVITTLLSVLAYCHEQRIVHRDLKASYHSKGFWEGWVHVCGCLCRSRGCFTYQSL